MRRFAMSSETFSKPCVKCGARYGTSGYEVFQCVSCKFVEWMPEAQRNDEK